MRLSNRLEDILESSTPAGRKLRQQSFHNTIANYNNEASLTFKATQNDTDLFKPRRAVVNKSFDVTNLRTRN